MKIKFILKAKDLNKKWLKSVKSLYGKQKLVISIEPDNGEEMDFDFDDDSWWEGDEEDFALEIDNTVDNGFNAEEYLASIEKQIEDESAKTDVENTEVSEPPVRQKRKWERRTPVADKPVKEIKTKAKTTETETKTEVQNEEAAVVEKKPRKSKKVVETATEEGEETPVKVKNKGERPKKVVAAADTSVEETVVSTDTSNHENSEA